MAKTEPTKPKIVSLEVSVNDFFSAVSWAINPEMAKNMRREFDAQALKRKTVRISIHDPVTVTTEEVL